MPLAPERFAAWMDRHRHVDPKYGHTYKYHSRSDAHSVALCEFIIQDLYDHSAVIRRQLENGRVAYNVNLPYRSATGKRKTLDLAIGIPTGMVQMTNLAGRIMARTSDAARLLVSCEAKATMTEHGKSQPRMFDELSSSHEIIHAGSQEAIACGIATINIASCFVSPLRQRSRDEVEVSPHNQPHVARRMVEHLRGLPIREEPGEVGFDAFCTFLVDCENTPQHAVTLWTQPPAPQPGDRDHYETFLGNIMRAYEDRFADIG